MRFPYRRDDGDALWGIEDRWRAAAWAGTAVVRAGVVPGRLVLILGVLMLAGPVVGRGLSSGLRARDGMPPGSRAGGKPTHYGEEPGETAGSPGHGR